MSVEILIFFVLLMVVLIHRTVGTLGDKTLDHLDRHFNTWLHNRGFARFPFAQNEINLPTAREIISDPETQSAKRLSA